jgi:hypothetical protein
LSLFVSSHSGFPVPCFFLRIFPCVLTGKLKQYLPHGVSPDNDLFLAMFLICLLPSVQEAVGARNHKTAMAMVRAADTLWDTRGSPDPTVAAATTQHEQKPSCCWQEED